MYITGSGYFYTNFVGCMYVCSHVQNKHLYLILPEEKATHTNSFEGILKSRTCSLLTVHRQLQNGYADPVHKQGIFLPLRRKDYCPRKVDNYSAPLPINVERPRSRSS